jgi:hypothetical protein
MSYNQDPLTLKDVLDKLQHSYSCLNTLNSSLGKSRKYKGDLKTINHIASSLENLREDILRSKTL